MFEIREPGQKKPLLTISAEGVPTFHLPAVDVKELADDSMGPVIELAVKVIKGDTFSGNGSKALAAQLRRSRETILTLEKKLSEEREENKILRISRASIADKLAQVSF